jgi:light-regulated signal transduction histidine kinase (bacteriophytochrome)
MLCILLVYSAESMLPLGLVRLKIPPYLEQINMSSNNADLSEPVQSKLPTEDLSLRLQELEERLRRVTVERDAAYRELDDLARFISHDLRAPLRGIDGYSKALLEDYSGRLDAVGVAYLQFIFEASRQAAGLIEKLIYFIRIQRAELHPQTIDLSQLVVDLGKRLQGPGRQGVAWVIAPSLVVTADQGMIQELMRNLLDNALKFTGKQNQAQIEVGEIETETGSAFFVHDNGAGFNMDYQDQLFQPFCRLHSSHEFEGAGLGLAIARRIVERHHGRIWAEGKVGQGATLYFTLDSQSYQSEP